MIQKQKQKIDYMSDKIEESRNELKMNDNEMNKLKTSLINHQ